MSAFSPIYDVSAAGCVANATLCAPAPKDGADGPASIDFPPANAAMAAPKAAARGWRRLIEALLNLISGPTLERSQGAV